MKWGSLKAVFVPFPSRKPADVHRPAIGLVVPLVRFSNRMQWFSLSTTSMETLSTCLNPVIRRNSASVCLYVWKPDWSLPNKMVVWLVKVLMVLILIELDANSALGEALSSSICVACQFVVSTSPLILVNLWVVRKERNTKHLLRLMVHWSNKLKVISHLFSNLPEKNIRWKESNFSLPHSNNWYIWHNFVHKSLILVKSTFAHALQHQHT